MGGDSERHLRPAAKSLDEAALQGPSSSHVGGRAMRGDAGAEIRRALHRFYEAHGFVEVDRTEGDNEEGQPDILYCWSSPV